MAALLRSAALLLAGAVLSNAQITTILPLITRPDLQAPFLNTTVFNPALVAPGFIFFTPNSPIASNFQVAPYIYTASGHLVYSGKSLMGAGMGAFNPNVCQYQGSDHICFTEFQGHPGGGPGFLGSQSIVLDNTYSVVQTLQPHGLVDGQPLTQDLHEFNMLAGGASALMTSYAPRAHNFTFPGCNNTAVTFFNDGVFSEITTDGQNTTLFQWSALDHIDPNETNVCPGQFNVGGGTSIADGFDFVHINSVDKNSGGDYLVSFRHLSALYLIAGLASPTGLAPGSTIWTMGGKTSSFPTMDSTVVGTPSLNFSFQHHARFHDSNIITLWDNANNAIETATASASSGMTIQYNFVGNGSSQNRATLIAQFISPDRQLDSSQGSHQLLPNGNHFLGLGSVPSIYEQTANGQTAFYANWGPLPLQSYRSFKFPWVGRPKATEIGFFPFQRTCNTTAAYWASWNGATEISVWKFFAGPSLNGTFTMVASAKYVGNFETLAMGNGNIFAYAVAFDAAGNLLGQSQTVATYVPNAATVGPCGTINCPIGTNYTTTGITCGANTTTTTTSTMSSTTTSTILSTSSSVTLNISTSVVFPNTTTSVPLTTSMTFPNTTTSVPITTTTIGTNLTTTSIFPTITSSSSINSTITNGTIHKMSSTKHNTTVTIHHNSTSHPATTVPTTTLTHSFSGHPSHSANATHSVSGHPSHSANATHSLSHSLTETHTSHSATLTHSAAHSTHTSFEHSSHTTHHSSEHTTHTTKEHSTTTHSSKEHSTTTHTTKEHTTTKPHHPHPPPPTTSAHNSTTTAHHPKPTFVSGKPTKSKSPSGGLSTHHVKPTVSPTALHKKAKKSKTKGEVPPGSPVTPKAKRAKERKRAQGEAVRERGRARQEMRNERGM